MLRRRSRSVPFFLLPVSYPVPKLPQYVTEIRVEVGNIRMIRRRPFPLAGLGTLGLWRRLLVNRGGVRHRRRTSDERTEPVVVGHFLLSPLLASVYCGRTRRKSREIALLLPATGRRRLKKKCKFYLRLSAIFLVAKSYITRICIYICIHAAPSFGFVNTRCHREFFRLIQVEE